MLLMRNVTVHFGRVPVLRKVDLDVPRGCIVGLVGRNGAGKTTTLRTVMGFLRVSEGTIEFDGMSILEFPPEQRARLGIGYVPEGRRLVPNLTVEENVLVPVWATGMRDGGTRLNRIYEVMPLVRELAARKAAQLSGGQQKVVALARALMVSRRLVLLDEVFEGLAPALVEEIGRGIKAFREDGVAVLVAESEYKYVEWIADKIFTIERGEVVGVKTR